ncbi:EF-Hand 1, calcium-binding site [Sesbania bispinosa]|nr:EF-Hand 1, calcium-binding site [Sesbania bispinosa]
MASQNPNHRNSLYPSIDVSDLAEDLVPDNTSPFAPPAVADEIQWPLAKDEAAVKVDDLYYFFSFRAPKDSDFDEEGEDRRKPDGFGSDMLSYELISKGQEGLLKELDAILQNCGSFSVQQVSEKAKKKREALDGSLHLFDKLPVRNAFFKSCSALLATNLGRVLHSYVVKQGHVSCQVTNRALVSKIKTESGSKEETKTYQEWFNLTDSDGDGRITGNEVTEFFALSNLPRS